ncbi:MAG TPA: hypothetical protein VF785_24655 [Gemmatimonadaceae bacterium]
MDGEPDGTIVRCGAVPVYGQALDWDDVAVIISGGENISSTEVEGALR